MRPTRFSKLLFYGVVFPLTLAFCGWQGWSWWSWAIAPVQSAETSSDPTEPTVQIQIPAGTSAQQIGQDLATVGLIRSTTAWNLWARWKVLVNEGGSFLAGTYALSPTDSMPDIADAIWQGDVIEGRITILEGWSIQDMAAFLESDELFAANEFVAATRQVTQNEYPWLPQTVFEPDGANLEGFLYPDTYQFVDAPTPQALVGQMLDRFEQVALPVYEQQRSLSPFTLLEWVSLASIVEKEAVVGDERSLIAAVFARRLREGIPLGADPTVEYALGIRQTPEQPLTLNEVNTPSPYNTYLNVGLPPGPIASPGLASLEASLAPDDTEYLYFVARYDGTHVFSRTLADHEAAQARIQDDIANQQQNPSTLPN